MAKVYKKKKEKIPLKAFGAERASLPVCPVIHGIHELSMQKAVESNVSSRVTEALHTS